MKQRKLQIILVSLLVLLMVSTVAYAYVGPSLGSRIIGYGSVGGDVQDLQNFLNGNGYSVGFADGIFGLKTKNSVLRFQKDNGLVADGIVGKQTVAAVKKIQNKNGTRYNVKQGDSLYSISAKYGLTTAQLKQANGLQSDNIYPGQVLIIPTGKNPTNPGSQPPTPASKPLSQILSEKGIKNQIPNVKIVVDKSQHLLTLYSGVTPLKSYRVALGDGGQGDKQRAGDHKTPEGNFYTTEAYPLSPVDQYLGSRWMELSYPNKEDADRGLANGLINQATHDQIYWAINNKQIPPQDTALGGGIGIHGGMETNDPTKDWTWGCVGLSNADVQEMFDYLPVGTAVVINN